MVRGGSWWFVVVRGGSWWFVVVRGGSWWFFSKILKKISCDPLFNQSESKIQYPISFWMRLCGGSWWFVVVQSSWFNHGGSWWFVVVQSWWFMVVHGGLIVVVLWWFVVVFLQKSPEKGHVTLYLTNHRTKLTMKSHFWWDFLFAPFHLKSIPLKSSAKNTTYWLPRQIIPSLMFF